MDTSEYMPMFLAEAQEHLQELNLAIVRLEEDPKDRETVDEIFRAAHSLKGMSATMGFAQIAKLTHEMEDVFELLRQRGEGLTREAIDTVLACLDALTASFESIEADGEEALDPTPLVERLHSLVRARTAEQELERVATTPVPDVVLDIATRQRVLHIVAVLDDQVLMPAVRAHMAFAAMGEHGELIASAPPVDEVEQFSGQRIEAWIASEHEEEAVTATVSTVSDVVGVEITEVAVPQAVTAPTPAPVAVPEVAATPEPARGRPRPSRTLPPSRPRPLRPRPPRRLAPSASTPSAWMPSCTPWESWSSTAPPSRPSPARWTCPGFSRRCRSSRAAPRRCSRWSCRSG